MKNRVILLVILFTSWLASACSEKNLIDEPEQPKEEQPIVQPTVGRYVSCPTPRHFESCKNDTLKVLLIGNSFAGDVLDGYLAQMLRVEKVPFIVARIHLTSCSIEMHLNNALSDNPTYNYLALRSKEDAIRLENVTMADALAMERWTHVSFQQVSTYSGIFEALGTDLKDLMAYVSDRTCYDTKRIFFQTWAYGPFSTASGFAKYGKSQMQMYNAICEVSQKIMQRYNFDILVPGGTAIQNARCTALGDDLTRDGMHLAIPQGRAIAGLVWCETLTGRDVRKNTYVPKGMTEEEITLAREAAHAAVDRPYEITKPESNDD